MEVEVEVTKADIGEPGVWSDESNGDKLCMLDRALERNLGERFYTLFSHSVNKSGRKEVRLPEEAIDARQRWDSRKPVQPFTFIATIDKF